MDHELRSLLTARVQAVVDSLVAALPAALDEEALMRYERKVWELKVFNIRPRATRHLLDAIGAGRAPGEFSSRALRCIRALGGDHCLVGPGGAGVNTSRVFAYAEYDVVAIGPAGLRADGSLCRESGLRGSSPSFSCEPSAASSSGRLRAFRLPYSGHVDRRLCAEFQILAELCDTFAPRSDVISPHTSVGILLLFTSTSPCTSCLCALRQFMLLFPEIAVEVSELVA